MLNLEHPAEQTADFVRRALPLMSKFNISYTPMNYSVWYSYVSSKNEELIKTIDHMIDAGTPFSPEANADLYKRFCTGKEENELQKVREDLQKVLLTILKEATELTDQTEEYEQFISKSVTMLSSDAPIQDIRQAIGEIMVKTRTLVSSRKIINARLQETTQALEMLKRDFAQAVTEATTDFLTGVANRKSFDEALTAYAEDTQLSGLPLALLLIDIDFFKRFNDQYGHLIGDEVLKFVAQKVKEKIRDQNLLARVGGEEFAVILPKTPLETARKVAEEIRNFFAKTPLKVKSSSRDIGTITVSIGLAVYLKGESTETFIHRTDQALYLAKNTGRNRVEWDR